MKIHFCDLCNESVPQNDLDQGRAFMRKGRVICATCDDLMGGKGSSQVDRESGTKLGGADQTSIAPESAGARTLQAGEDATLVQERRSGSPAPYRSEGSGALVAGFLASVSLILVAVVAVILLDRVQAIGDGIETDFAALREDMAGIETGLEQRIDEVQATATAGTKGLDNRMQTMKESREEADRQTVARIESVAGGVEDLRDRVTSLTTTERAVADHARSLAAIDAGLASIRLDLAALAEEVAARPVIAAVPVPLPVEPAGPTWLALVDDLASTNSGVRWNAVEDLGHTADPEVVPHLLPVLDDEDTFVRMAAARVLGDLGSDTAVGPLIDTLSDPAPSVRDAAVSSLRLLTQENFRYDPLGKEADRNKRIRAWRDWWEEQQGTA